MTTFRLALPLVALASLTACGSTTGVNRLDYTRFNEAAPHSVLVVPVINHSNETQAADLFLTTLAVPLAERGYYVFPTNMSKKLIDNEGLSDPGLVHASQPRKRHHFLAQTQCCTLRSSTGRHDTLSQLLSWR